MNYSRRSSKNREKKLNSVGAKVGNKFVALFWRFVLVCLALAAVVGIAAGIGIWKGIIDTSPDMSAYDVVPTGYYSTVYADDGTTELATLVASGSNRKFVTIDETPLDLQHAFVAIEDTRFYEHNGIDLYGIARAFVSGLLKGSFNEGASTITQQLIKNNVLTSWTSETSFIEKLQRKVQEQYLAVQLEKQVDKDYILENYMNTINLGSNCLGVAAAAQKYFGKECADLTLSECAVIAGITQNPSAYNPITHPENNQVRRKKVLDNMLELGFITQEAYDEALADDVYARIDEHHTESTATTNYNSYFVDAVIDDVYQDLVDAGYTESDANKYLYNGGLTIISTQNLYMQSIVDEEVSDSSNYDVGTTYSFQLSFQVLKADGTYKTYTNNTMLSYYKQKTGNEDYTINYSSEEACYDAIWDYEAEMVGEGDSFVEGSESVIINPEPQVAMTVIDQSTGYVVALSGGRGDKTGNRTWNRATDTKRQPGSTFKIIGCFAAALDSGGKTLASTQYDEAYTVGSKTFHDYSKNYRGWTSIREAIEDSINVVTVKTLEDIGVNLGYQYAENFGITSLCDGDKNLSLCLGGLTNGVTNLELTGAYATIANGGTYLEPKFYSVVYDHDGNVLLDATETQESHQVISEQTAWLLTNAMEDVLTKGTGTRAYFGSSMPQAGKSGTTTSNRDALFAGFTPYYTCVVWGGYDDNSKQSSTGYPKNLWRAVMSRIHEDLPYKDFETPEGIYRTAVCTESGDKPGSMCPTTYEYFAEGSGPSATCSLHVTATVCKETGLLPTEYCEETETQVFTREAVPTKECTTHTEEWKAEQDRLKEEEEAKQKEEEEAAKKAEEEAKKAEEAARKALEEATKPADGN